MSAPLGLIEAVMLEVLVVVFGVRELYLLRKDEKTKATKPQDGAPGDDHDVREK